MGLVQKDLNRIGDLQRIEEEDEERVKVEILGRVREPEERGWIEAEGTRDREEERGGEEERREGRGE